MNLPKISAVVSAVLLIGIIAGSVSATDSTTITDNTTTTSTDNNFVVRIVPDQVLLKPLQTITFHAIVTTPNGNQYEAPADYTQWNVLKGGGHISPTGIFRAGEIPGTYANTIVVKVLEKAASASVKIVDLIQITPSPTPGLQIDTITNTPTPSSSTTGTNDGTNGANPSPTPSPTPKPTPINLPSTTIIVPTFTPPTPTPTPINSSNGNSISPTIRPQKTPTPTPKITPRTTSDSTTPVDKTQSENISNMYRADDVQLCLKTVYSAEIYASYFSPTGEQKNPSELGSLLSAAQRCFKINRTIDLDAQTIACLKQILSEKRYSQITVDNQSPTSDELLQAKACTTKPREISYARKNELDPTLLSCLEIKLGTKRLQQILESGARPVASELTNARECFTLDEGITQPPLVINLPEETQTCLEDALGVARATEIQEGKSKATFEERTIASNCFTETLDTSQQAFMPPSVEQLPYIEPATSKEVTITSVQAKTHVSTEVLTLSGKTEPFAVVDIYIFSDPIIVSTTADANGDWFYELSYHLDDGNHEAYTVVQHPEKGYVKSEVFAFNVARASSGTSVTPKLVVEPINTSSITRTYLVAAVGITGVGIILLLLVGYWFTKRQPAKLPGLHSKENNPTDLTPTQEEEQ
ncbi:hypothetical protein GW793_03910 [bacterium]|nr:hypothetical protein [bacterium]